VGQAGYPPDPIRRREGAITVSRTIIVTGTNSTADRGAILFMKRAASSQAHRTAEPRTLTLLASKRPLHFELDDLLVTVDSDGNLSPAETTDAQYRVVFQELMVRPFSPST